MNVQKEMDFLKEATLGLFNKKGTSFNFGTRPYANGEKIVEILIVNSSTTTSGDVLRLSISYATSADTAFAKLEVNSRDLQYSSQKISQNVPKTLLVSFIQSTLDSVKDKADNVFSSEEDKVDFYAILEALANEVFNSNDLFELNGWRKTVHLHDMLKTGYSSLIEEYHVHGGVGQVKHMSELHNITTSIELAKLPTDGITYLGVKSIAPNVKYPTGLYVNGTLEIFVESVIEQYKGAWNR